MEGAVPEEAYEAIRALEILLTLVEVEATKIEVGCCQAKRDARVDVRGEGDEREDQARNRPELHRSPKNKEERIRSHSEQHETAHK